MAIGLMISVGLITLAAFYQIYLFAHLMDWIVRTMSKQEYGILVPLKANTEE